MWSPHPKGRITRRPQPDFCHRRTRIQRRPTQRELAESQPDPRRNTKYFGIHRSDVTDYLKHVVPSHAFHPSLVGPPPPLASGRCPRHLKGKRRPDSAPAPTVWFGRTCSDVSDWLRYRPPAHLGLDPDNKPLPYYPTSTSLVTDAKWQTREFPPLPHILWHFWAERPSSVPLATTPQQVNFDILADAAKHNRIALKERQSRPCTPASPAAHATPISTPRSGANAQIPQLGVSPRHGPQTPPGGTARSRAQTPRGDQTPRSLAQTPRGDQTPRSSGAQTPRGQTPLSNNGAQTPRGQDPLSGAHTPRNDSHLSSECRMHGTEIGPPRSILNRTQGATRLAGELTLRDRPCSAPSACSSVPNDDPGLAAATLSGMSTPRSNTVSMGMSPRPPLISSLRPHSAPQSPLGSCGCGKPPNTLRSACNAEVPSTPREFQCACINGFSSTLLPSIPRGGAARSVRAAPPSTGTSTPRSGLPTTRLELSKCARNGLLPPTGQAPISSPRSGYSATGVAPCVGPPPVEALKRCSCNMQAPSPTTRSSSTSARGVAPTTGTITPRPPPGIEVPRCASNGHSSPSLNRGVSTTPTSTKSASPSVYKPPPSPRLVHPNPLHIPRQPVLHNPCERHPAAIPQGLYVQGLGQGYNVRGAKIKT